MRERFGIRNETFLEKVDKRLVRWIVKDGNIVSGKLTKFILKCFSLTLQVAKQLKNNKFAVILAHVFKSI